MCQNKIVKFYDQVLNDVRATERAAWRMTAIEPLVEEHTEISSDNNKAI